MKTEKVIIVGGGPAGLAAAIYLGRADLHPLVIAGSPPGGQLTLTNEVENYPGFYSILGKELIQKMRKQAKKFGARFVDQNVARVNFSEKPFRIYTSDQIDQPYKSEVVLIATGAKTSWLGLASEQRLRGKGISACATCDGFFFKDKIVAVIGGGDTALEEALTLTKFAKKVYIIHRRHQFRASKILQNRVFKNPKIEIIWDALVEEILGEEKVRDVRLKLTKIKKPIQPISTNKLKIDGVFVAIGRKPATEFLQNSGVLLDEKGYVITLGAYALRRLKEADPNYELPARQSLTLQASAGGRITNYNYQSMASIPGVFAAGDVADPIFRQVATAVGSGVSAALEIERYLTA
jgi:thioredoxin reductase (NADPH)